MVSLYDLLGVEPSVSDDELRRAYRRLVRTYHPDRHASESPEVRGWAEERMRELTRAWTELGDPERRRSYDLSMRGAAAVEAAAQPAAAWTPYDDGPDVVDERLDDSHRPPPRGGRALAMLPPVVLASGVVLLVAGVAMTSRLIIAVGLMGVALGLGLFAVVSLSVLMESRHRDLH